MHVERRVFCEDIDMTVAAESAEVVKAALEEASLYSESLEHNCDGELWSKFDNLMLSANTEGSNENT